ncbi:VOC family protein [Paracoccus siganidrum]|uniref:VOC family protein n=1 Tax=Paracoccus siganidrum TaxID=1276757 RepID=A0A419A9B5_9RHOB|nr:VOC family protein [Paracoccus siganidrum]RJL18824.1 VOC family protein [Paracoccus siganidrum]RMC38856.1 VOC family protein [Paracoccus siganidrum]
MSYPRQRVTLITLGVADLERSRDFYARWGWQPHGDSAPGVFFYQMQGAVLALFGLSDLAEDQGRPGATLGAGAMTLAQNCASEAEVDAVFDAALEAGAELLKRPEKVFWGGYSGYFADPDGHVWEIAMNPFWPLSPDGALTLPDAAGA